MKVMLLAAGKGERMRPLTNTTPKPLLKAAGKPLIIWHLERLAESGFTEIVINHAWLGQQIENELGSGQQFGLSIEYSGEREPLETAGGIQQALPLLGSSPFVVISADIWTDYPFQKLHGVSLGSHLAYLTMVTNAPHHPEGDFTIENDNLKLADTGTVTFTYSGIGIFSPAMFAGLAPGKLPLRPLLEDAITDNKIAAELYEGLWWDIGTPERLNELEKYLASRRE